MITPTVSFSLKDGITLKDIIRVCLRYGQCRGIKCDKYYITFDDYRDARDLLVVCEFYVGDVLCRAHKSTKMVYACKKCDESTFNITNLCDNCSIDEDSDESTKMVYACKKCYKSTFNTNLLCTKCASEELSASDDGYDDALTQVGQMCRSRRKDMYSKFCENPHLNPFTDKKINLKTYELLADSFGEPIKCSYCCEECRGELGCEYCVGFQKSKKVDVSMEESADVSKESEDISEPTEGSDTTTSKESVKPKSLMEQVVNLRRECYERCIAKIEAELLKYMNGDRVVLSDREIPEYSFWMKNKVIDHFTAQGFVIDSNTYKGFKFDFTFDLSAITI